MYSQLAKHLISSHTIENVKIRFEPISVRSPIPGESDVTQKTLINGVMSQQNLHCIICRP